jgi:hypothetical protein
MTTVTTPNLSNINNPCCNAHFVPRTRWIGSVVPPNTGNEVVSSNLYPFWGLWRTTNSVPLPQVFYPSSIFPREWCQ